VCSCWRCSIIGKLAWLWSVACRSSSRTWKAIAGQRCQGDGETAHRQPIGRAVAWSGIGMLDHRQTGGAVVGGVPLIEPHLEGDRRPAGQVDGETAYRQPIGRAVAWSGSRDARSPAVLPGRNRSHPLKKIRQRDDLYGIVVKLGNDLTDAARCT
jgi:hypothetical protein